MIIAAIGLLAAGLSHGADPARPYTVVDTGQDRCFGADREIDAPGQGDAFHGQDAQCHGPPPAYRDNGDGTVTDLNTGLMWVRARGEKMTWKAAAAGATACRIGRHADWRMPSIKELYSLIDFRGGHRGTVALSRPYIDTNAFDFVYGDESKGERSIDSQDWSATEYIATTMNGNPTVFGVNFADGRIKGYPKTVRRRDGGGVSEHTLYVRYVRGNPAYGRNSFRDNGDGTVTDQATGLMWARDDSGNGMDWPQALAYASDLKLAGHDDWRLPNAKELQSIVDYTRIPAIDPVFRITRLDDGEYPFYWTGTTHLEGRAEVQARAAVYIAFGRALGWMQLPPGQGEYRLLDVHGAGAQRSDPKTGDPALFPHGRGPQGDVVRIANFARCVRGGAN